MLERIIGIGGCLIGLLWLMGCARYEYREKKPLSGILRDYQTGAILSATLTAPKLPEPPVYTDSLGYFEFPKHTRNQLGKGDIILVQTASRIDTIPLAGNMTFLSLLLNNTATKPPKTLDPVADMHYHITLKPHNEYGLMMYRNPEETTRRKIVERRLFLFKKTVLLPAYNNPTDKDPYLLWSLRTPKTKVLFNGNYVKPGEAHVLTEQDNAEVKAKLATLYEGRWIKPQKRNNGLYHYTQATMPHLRAGNVRLAFNAISPFEYNLANTWQKRLISNVAKSNGQLGWLKLIGSYDTATRSFYLTHWQNFQNENALLKKTLPEYNRFGWKYLTSGRELDQNPRDTHFIVNVLEGSHALQGDVLMKYLYITKEEEPKQLTKQEIIEKIKTIEQIKPDPETTRKYNPTNKKLADLPTQTLDSTAKGLEKSLRTQALEELCQNIRTLKADTELPIFMVTISHLSWNGMTGHAPALDANGLARPFIKRFYRIKASDDKSLLGQWKSLFYSEPINEFGKIMIHDLLDRNIGGRRILVDLKHADYFTRKYFYEFTQTLPDTVPPICSHCAVNGLKEIYHSPFVDEYSLLKSSADSVFYPFGLNLYDEEITTICQRGGIIGLPLEQRVLGGYPKKARIKLIDHSMRLMQADTNLRPLFNKIWHYNRDEMHIPEPLSRERFMDDYYSVEPFLQNLFYILDHSQKKTAEAWAHVCLGSDLDGIIDPIDVCATASQYPHFRERLRQFVPLFLHMRHMHNPDAHEYKHYFEDQPLPPGATELPSLTKALDALLYESLKEFVRTNFNR